ncbi:DgyrCDS9481 [Dimorphilus gyrociliatus]|uniref:DgyrCDS9481 n=1 Tax=Dimorphilus gyrociliatus TaxID=2664684 RepID=A0A7I8VYR7_9ANNE|nr:DgyrCDS9481 [Dimorphilus gyrociliatus]
MDIRVDAQANKSRIELVDAAFQSGEKLYKENRILIGEGVLTKYNQKKIIPLRTVKVVPIADSFELQNAWQIKSAQKSFTVFAATATEKSEWMSHISQCVKDLLSKEPNHHDDDSLEESPVWVPDNKTTECFGCQVNFTTFNRRHHCRKCGKIFCGTCSKYKELIVSQDRKKPLRVCFNCFSKRNQSSNSLERNSTNSTPLTRDSDDTDDSDQDVEDRKSETYDHQTQFFQ